MNRSLIAGANALFRAKESTRPNGDRILVDPFAHALAERALRVSAVRFARFVIPPLQRTIDELQTAHCVRHRAIDELVLAAIAEHGVRQVVVIGAGYDMRASRFSQRINGVKWIEVDHPATQARKVALLRAMHEPKSVERVSVDLMDEPLERALARSSFDDTLDTCFVAEGVIHYLSNARFDALLSSIASVRAPVRFVFSFIRDEMYAEANPLFLALVTSLREVPALSFSRQELVARCGAHGLDRLSTFTLNEQIERFAPMARERRVRLSQDVGEAIRASRAPTSALRDR